MVGLFFFQGNSSACEGIKLAGMHTENRRPAIGYLSSVTQSQVFFQSFIRVQCDFNLSYEWKETLFYSSRAAWV